MIVIKTSKGDIKLTLDAVKAPKTTANFLQYARSGFYNDTIFHRVIDGFMIQGGGLTAAMESKSTSAPVENEAKSGLANKRGTIAMARTMDPHSATSQFFINLADNAFLNYSGDHAAGHGYCAFGEVVDGMDVVDAMAKVNTTSRGGHGDVPVDDVVIYGISDEA